jgi:hypothetical protein
VVSLSPDKRTQVCLSCKTGKCSVGISTDSIRPVQFIAYKVTIAVECCFGCGAWGHGTIIGSKLRGGQKWCSLLHQGFLVLDSRFRCFSRHELNLHFNRCLQMCLMPETEEATLAHSGEQVCTRSPLLSLLQIDQGAGAKQSVL